MRIVILTTLFCALTCGATDSWPQMRGPSNDGYAANSVPPLKWSETENVTWKIAIPGQGWSSPVVANDKVWMTTATDAGKSRRVICVDAKSGKIIHDKELFHIAEPAEKHDFNSYASPTPVIDDGKVYITFGTDGTACLDGKSGDVLWKQETLKCDHYRGAGSSPIVYENLLILHYDGIDVQYIAAMDKATGKAMWKTDRSHIINKDGDFKKAYTIPLRCTVDGSDQLISIGAECVYGYAPGSGKELWRCRFNGFSNAVLPSHGNGLFYVNTGFGKATLLAIKEGGEGDVTDSHIAWQHLKNVGRMSSPLLIKDRLYIVSDNGTGTCLNAVTGEEIWHTRLGRGLSFTASPIYANGHIYFFDHRAGAGIILKPGDTPNIVATNTLDTGCMASPALVGNTLFLRSKTHLYRIE